PDILLPKQARYQTALYPDVAQAIPPNLASSTLKSPLIRDATLQAAILLNLGDQRQRRCTIIAQPVIIEPN
ncbi:MAG: hypothetical protein ACPH91_06835, partial [Pseudomonadales bacterium]